jgi:hypothetical protein
MKLFSKLFFAFVLSTLFFGNAKAGGNPYTACFTDTTQKTVQFPIVRCHPFNLNLSNCSTGNFDSVVWRINYTTNYTCDSFQSSLDIPLGGIHFNDPISYGVNQNGSYSITIYIYNTSVSTLTPVDSFTNCVASLFTGTIYTNLVANRCNGSVYQFNQLSITNSGVYGDTLKSVEGCDSIINLSIQFYNQRPKQSTSVNLCAGTIYTWQGVSYDSSGTYLDTLVAYTGCDSIIELKLSYSAVIQPTYYTNTLCYGQYFIFRGDTLRTAGTYFDTLQSISSGCDSIIALSLSILNPITPGVKYDTVCFGTNYDFNGTILSNAGTYIDTIPTAITSCDSIVTLYLYIRPQILSADIYDTTCKDIPYVFGGSTFNFPGDYGFLLKNQFGCDSNLVLHLAVTDLNPAIVKMHDTLYATGIGAIQWIDCSTNLPISGANTNYYIPTITGTYAAIFTGLNCIASTDCIFDSLSVGITDIAIKNQVSVFPNPANQSIVISCNNSINTIQIQNVTGQIMKSESTKVNSNNLQINISDLAQGIYFIKATDSKGNMLNGKFVKE